MGWRGTLRSMVALSRRIERERLREANRVERAHHRMDSLLSKLSREAQRDAAKVEAFEERLFRSPVQTLKLRYDTRSGWAAEPLVDRTGQITFSIGPRLVDDRVSFKPARIEFEGRVISPVACCLSPYATFVAFSLHVAGPPRSSRPSRRLVKKAAPEQSAVFIVAGDQVFYGFDGTIDGPVLPGVGRVGIVAFEPFVDPVQRFEIGFLPRETKATPDPDPVFISVGGSEIPDVIDRFRDEPSLVEQFERKVNRRLSNVRRAVVESRTQGKGCLVFLLAVIVLGALGSVGFAQVTVQLWSGARL